MEYKVYTDGSCTQTSKLGGYGLVVTKNGENIYEATGAYAETTNNRMEMSALIEAFKYMVNIAQEGDSVIFFVDSAYIVNCFEQKWYLKWRANGWRTSNRLAVKNQDKWKELFDVCKKCERKKIDYKITKVKAHVDKTSAQIDNEWNSYADALANQWRGLNEEDLIIDQE